LETVALPRKKSPGVAFEMTRFDGELLRKARAVVSIRRHPNLGRYISDHARAGIEADYDAVIREESRKLPKKREH
jgi:hypothetical protein